MAQRCTASHCDQGFWLEYAPLLQAEIFWSTSRSTSLWGACATWLGMRMQSHERCLCAGNLHPARSPCAHPQDRRHHRLAAWTGRPLVDLRHHRRHRRHRRQHRRRGTRQKICRASATSTTATMDCTLTTKARSQPRTFPMQRQQAPS